MFSRRVPSDFTENAIARALASRQRPYIDLTASNPTRAGLSPTDSEIFRALDGRRLGSYTPDPRGLLSAREAVCEEYARAGFSADPRRIFLTASTSEAYSFLFRLLCDPGDAALVPEPSYPLFDHLMELDNIRKVPYRLSRPPGGEWEIDAVSVARGFENGARALLLVHPNNPTGSYVKKDELAAVAGTLDPEVHAVVSDEVFFGYRLRKTRAEPLGVAALADPSALTFSLSGISKSCGLPQMKLGWILVGGPSEAAARAIERLELIADTYLSVSTPVQLALPELFRVGGRTAERICVRLLENLASAEAIFGEERSGGLVRAIPPEGGWSLPLHLPPDLDEERCVLELLETRDVLVSPGWFFEFGAENFLVASLLVPPDDFREAASRIAEYFGGI